MLSKCTLIRSKKWQFFPFKFYIYKKIFVLYNVVTGYGSAIYPRWTRERCYVLITEVMDVSRVDLHLKGTTKDEILREIVDIFDNELLRVHKMLVNNKPQTSYDDVYLNIYNTIQNYGEIDDIAYDSKDEEQEKIIKTAKILMNKEIYSACYI